MEIVIKPNGLFAQSIRSVVRWNFAIEHEPNINLVPVSISEDRSQCLSSAIVFQNEVNDAIRDACNGEKWKNEIVQQRLKHRILFHNCTRFMADALMTISKFTIGCFNVSFLILYSFLLSFSFSPAVVLSDYNQINPTIGGEKQNKNL